MPTPMFSQPSDPSLRGLPGVLLAVLLLLVTGLGGRLGAADVTLSADRTSIVAGETVTVSVDLGTVPAFRTWGIQVTLPVSSASYLGQGAGSLGTFVADSRTTAAIASDREVHLGGYSASDLTGGGTLAQLQVRFASAGTYTITLPAKDVSHPFGGAWMDGAGGLTAASVGSGLVISVRNPDTVSITAGADAQEPSTVGGFTISRPGSVGDLVVPLNVRGTAVAGVDYAPLPSQVTIANGTTSTVLPVTPLTNPQVTGNRTLVVDLLDGPDYGLSVASAAIAVLDADAPTVHLTLDRSTAVVGDVVEVSLVLDQALPITSWGGAIVFPSAKAVPATGTWQQGAGIGTFVGDSRSVDLITSSAQVHAGGRLSGGTSGPGVLGRFSFRLTAQGTTSFSLPAQGSSVFGAAVMDAAGHSIIPRFGAPVAVTVAAPPLVTVAALGTRLVEGGAPVAFRLSRPANATAADQSVTLAWSGSAYPGRTGSLVLSATIPAGQTTVDVPVSAIDDSVNSRSQGLVLTVVDGDGYDPGNPASAALQVVDNDGAVLSLLADHATTVVGGNVLVTTRVDGAQAFQDFGVILTFDPTHLQVLGQGSATVATIATFVPDSETLTQINTRGSIHLGGHSSTATAGALAAVAFRVLISGDTVVSTSIKDVYNPFGALLLAHDGSAQVPNLAGDLVIHTSGSNNPPTGSTLDNLTLTAGRPAGTVVGQLTAIDADSSQGDTFTFALVPGTGGEDNADFTISGATLRTAGSLTPGSRSILVEVADAAGATAQTVFTVTVQPAPTVLRVDALATGAGNGLTWADAFPRLEDALAAAVSGTSIWVREGTYQGSGLSQATEARWDIPSGVDVLGGFAGTETLATERDWAAHQVVLDGQGHRVVALLGGSLRGVRITGGSTTSSTIFQDFGGGILIEDAGVDPSEVSECVITGNAARYGGGIYIAGPATVSNCVIVGNLATVSGGGLAIRSDTGGDAVAVEWCSVAGNLAQGSGALHGGGLSYGLQDPENNQNTLLRITGCIFQGNAATAGSDTDAAIQVGSNPLLADCRLGLGFPTVYVDGGGNATAPAPFTAVTDPVGPDLLWLTADDGLIPAISGTARDAIASGFPQTDIRGVARPQGSGADIGAYESPAAAPVPVITSALTATGTVGLSFSYQISASNGPTSFTAAGLPTGLTVNASGLISGIPAVSGSASVTIAASNGNGTGSAVLALTIIDAPVVPVITSSLSAGGMVGQAFSYQISASGNPTSFTAAGLPAGLTVDGASGLISGVPAVSGSASVTIAASNGNGTGSALLALTIADPVPVIASSLSASGVVGQPFSYQVSASGNPTGYAASGLPSGLGIDPLSGLISGTPLIAGTSSVTIAASNGSGTGSAVLSLTILPAAPVISSSLVATGTVSAAFTYQITASGSPQTFAATGLPTGLSIDAATGLISGAPTSTGVFPVTISASNASGTGSATLTLTIGAAPVVTVSTPAVSGVEGAGILAGTVALQITVHLSVSPTQAISVPFTITGTAGSTDATVPASPLLFAPGEQDKTLLIPLAEDGPDGSGGTLRDETVIITLGSSGGALVGSPSQAVLTIIDAGPLTGVATVGSAQAQDLPTSIATKVGATVRLDLTGGVPPYAITNPLGDLLVIADPASQTDLDGDGHLDPAQTIRFAALRPISGRQVVVTDATGASLSATVTAVRSGVSRRFTPPAPPVSRPGSPRYAAICPGLPEGLDVLRAGLAGKSRRQARAFTWDALRQTYAEMPAQPSGGQSATHAVFLITRQAIDLGFDAEPAPFFTATTLEPGFNFVGLPPMSDGDTTEVNHAWSELLLFDPAGNQVLGSARDALIGSGAWYWSGSSYGRTATIESGKGYFIENRSAGGLRLRLVRVPAGFPTTGLVLRAGASAPAPLLLGRTVAARAAEYETRDLGPLPTPPADESDAPADEVGGGGCGGGSVLGLILLSGLALARRRRTGLRL